jgi:lipopolysaccharide export system ATP-binding protein
LPIDGATPADSAAVDETSAPSEKSPIPSPDPSLTDDSPFILPPTPRHAETPIHPGDGAPSEEPKVTEPLSPVIAEAKADFPPATDSESLVASAPEITTSSPETSPSSIPPTQRTTDSATDSPSAIWLAEENQAAVHPPSLPYKSLLDPAVHGNGHPADEHSPLLIQTHGLVKQYGGRRVVNGVDIHVRAGEVVGLLGKNGAGKTTTFYMIVGLVPPTEGHVYMGEEDVTRMPMYRRARRGIGYLPQEESIFRKLSVEDNLLAILETLPMSEEERDNRCDELLKDFGLEHVRENIAITLSGGEKRRVTIARALVTSPTLLLLDEPFSGVDPMAVHDIQEIILHLKERGLGVLITDHNVRETLSVVDRAYIIDEGRVLSQGSREFVMNDPIAREIYLGHRFSM